MKNVVIKEIDTRIVDLPLKRLQQFARLGARHQSSVVIRVRTDAGVEGLGESVTPCGPWWSGDTVEAIKSTIDLYLAPLLIGEDPTRVDALMAKMRARVRNNAFAKAGIEMALLDCVGKLVDAPLYVLLGGKHRDSLEMAWPLASGDLAQDLDEAEEMLSSRKSRIFKIKMGALAADADLVRVVAIADALRGRARIRVDPNEAWDEVTTIRALGILEGAGIELVEQPVARWNLDAMARITRQARSVIMIDEGVQSTHDMVEVIKRAAASLVSLKVMKSGGLRASRAMADMASAAGLPVYLGTFLETSIGTAANMHLAASIERLPYGGETIGPMLMADDVCVERADYHDFALWLGDAASSGRARPGLGVELDPDRFDFFDRNRQRRVVAVEGLAAG